MKVFVAGPYGDGNPKSIIARNVAIAEQVGRNLLAAGHFVFVPHSMTWGWENDRRLTTELFLKNDLAFLLHWAEAVIRMPGKSKGAEQEMEVAKNLGLTIIPYEDYAPKSLPTAPIACSHCHKFLGTLEKR